MTKTLIQKATRVSAATAFVVLGAVSGASATTMNLKFDGWEAGYKTVNVTEKSGNIAAGAFNMKETPGTDSFLVYCLDILANIYTNETYGYKTTDTPFSNSVDLTSGGVDRIQKLFDTGYAASLANATSSAGFQVALWNAVYDTDWSVSENEGTFYQTASNGGVRDAANGFLSTAAGFMGSSKYKLTFLESTETPTRSQNLVTATPVPLPAAGFMLLTALGGLLLGRRRKAA